MRQLLILFGIAITLLATSLHVDAAAHPCNVRYAGEVQAFETDGTQESDGQKGPCSVCLTHHHCSNVATYNTNAALDSVSWSMPIYSEGIHRSLSSRSDDPLLEPPSA